MRHPHRAADDAFLVQAGIEAARLAEAGLQAVGHAVHAAERAHILAEDQDGGVARHLVFQRLA